MTEEKKLWIGLNLLPGIGSILFSRLLERFSSIYGILNASYDRLLNVQGINDDLAKSILQFPQNDLEKELQQIEKLKIDILTFEDKDYPSLLKHIFNPPPVLYVKGKIIKSDLISIAIVGSRITSFYGKRIAEKLTRELVEYGFTIVSGLARGIDTIAHQEAIKNKGRTIAILGCGLSKIYPPENKKIKENIINTGAIISEFPLSTPPYKQNFPLRNRIISGISLGTLVIEAREKSGALITSNFALEQNREVFAIPGNIDSKYSVGTNRLIKQGAKLVENVEDIIEELKVYFPKKKEKENKKEIIVSLTKEEKTVYDLLSYPLYIDLIFAQSKIEANKVLEILMNLELKG